MGAMRRALLLLIPLGCNGPASGDPTSASSSGPGSSSSDATTSSSASTSTTATTPGTSSEPTTDAPTSTSTSAGVTSEGTTDPSATTDPGTTASTGSTASTGPDSTGTGSTGSTSGGPLDCQPGEQKDCYSGPDGTAGQGKCKEGLATCDDMGTFGPCQGEVLPAPESCDTPGDEDCDGIDPCTGEGPYQWHKTWGMGGSERGVRVAFDNTGAIVLASSGTGAADFGGGVLISAGSWDLFLAKFSPDGAHLWSKRFGDAAPQFGEGWALAIAANDDILVAGDFDGQIDFGGGPFTSNNIADGFLARFTKDGAHVWSKELNSTNYAIPRALGIDKDGAIYLSGDFTGSLDLGGGMLNAPGVGRDLFVGKFTAAGAHTWSARYGDANTQYMYALAVDATSNVYVGGSFDGTLNFGNGPITGAGSDDIFLAKLSPIGNAVWSKRFGDANPQELYGMTIDANGRITITGVLRGPIDFGGGPLVAPSLRGYAAQFDGAGAHVWSRTLGAGDARPWFIDADGLGSLVLTGYFSGSNDFGGGVLTSEGDHDIFALKLAPGGAHVWSKSFGDFAAQEGIGSAASSTGRAAICGTFVGAVNFGGGPVTTKGGTDGFLAVFGP